MSQYTIESLKCKADSDSIHGSVFQEYGGADRHGVYLGWMF
jgi:hypothetical protein